MRDWKIYEVPISKALKKTTLGTTVALRKIPISERKKWREWTWTGETNREGQRIAVFLAQGRVDDSNKN